MNGQISVLANATYPAITLEFAYDGLSRRVQKKTITNGTPTLEGYLYDGWNVVMISNLNPADGAHLARKWSCVWRPDVGSRLYARSSWQEAGGVGGLVWMQTGIAQTVAMDTYQSVTGNAEVHIPMMDPMGNVRHYYQIKSTGPGTGASTVTGQVTANIDYDAFGREVRATGPKTPASGQPPGLTANDPWVDTLPFHFSTKFTDRESGLNYYGYRFYDPVDGRWLSRDPINEAGNYEGLRSNARTLRKSDQNLHLMVYNDPIQRLDYLGLASSCEIVVECRRVGNDPNASPQGVVIGIVSAMLNQGRPAVHCSLVVKREGFQGRRYEMGGVGGDVSPSDDRWQRYPTTPNGKGSSFCTPCECVGALAGELEDEAPPYQPLGPNCNTYIHKLLAKCGLKIKPFKLPYSAGVGHGGLLDMDEPIGAFGW